MEKEKGEQDLRQEKGDATLVYVLTDACNFRCCYCYENSRNSLLKNRSCFQSLFSLESLMKAYQIFCRYYKRPRSIVFFGGEPLLQKELIYGFICELKKGQDTVPEFAIITNASVMDEKWSRFMAENFSAVTFSLDGASEIHNAYRLDSNGQGTFSRVVENIRRFQQCNTHTKVTVEATLTKAYAREKIQERCEKTWRLFRSLGISLVDYIPVEGEEYSLFQSEEAENAKSVVNALLDLWFRDFLSLQLTTDVISFRSRLLSVIAKRPSLSCGAGKNYFAVTPDLSVYPCQVALFRGNSPKWRFLEDGTMTEAEGGACETDYSRRNHPFCRECECFSSCTCYCRVRWENDIPKKLPDTCRFHRLAQAGIVERIKKLYEDGDKERLKTAVIKYYGRKS